MLRRLFAAILILIIAATPMTLSAARTYVNIDSMTDVSFNGRRPIVVDGRTLVPARPVFEALGFTVDWDEPAQTVTMINTPYTIIITIGSPVFTTNGEEFELDVPAQVVNGSTMLPIRAVVESLPGMTVSWRTSSWTPEGVPMAHTITIHTTHFIAEQDLLGQWRAMFFIERISGEPEPLISIAFEYEDYLDVYLEFFADGTAVFSETGQPDITARWSLEDRMLRFDDGVDNFSFHFFQMHGQLGLLYRGGWVPWEGPGRDISWTFERP